MHQARDLVHAVAEGRGPEPSFADGLQVQRVLAAVEESAEKNSVYTPILP
ncbi:Gfo/Idh/MocA family oxidoreductase [Streptomyces violaceorubidus]